MTNHISNIDKIYLNWLPEFQKKSLCAEVKVEVNDRHVQFVEKSGLR